MLSQHQGNVCATILQALMDAVAQWWDALIRDNPKDMSELVAITHHGSYERWVTRWSDHKKPKCRISGNIPAGTRQFHSAMLPRSLAMPADSKSKTSEHWSNWLTPSAVIYPPTLSMGEKHWVSYHHDYADPMCLFLCVDDFRIFSTAHALLTQRSTQWSNTKSTNFKPIR